MAIEKRLIVELELNVIGDGRAFLNFWDYKHGNDVVAELKDGKLIMDFEGIEKEISLSDFIERVKNNFK